jgi:hypothetical protein
MINGAPDSAPEGGRAVRSEPCRENLRAYAAVLADAGTILT